MTEAQLVQAVKDEDAEWEKRFIISRRDLRDHTWKRLELKGQQVADKVKSFCEENDFRFEYRQDDDEFYFRLNYLLSSSSIDTPPAGR